MKRITIILLFLNICVKCIYSDNLALERLSSFVTNINTFNKLNPQEKVYIHFDNNVYFIGDTIWFKSYIVTSEKNKKTDLSGVLYVELLSEKGAVLESKKLKITDGKCHGEFVLKNEYYSGFYEVRAFTRCMFNWGDEALFSRVLPIFMTPETKDDFEEPEMYMDNAPKRELLRKKTLRKKKINLDFYPEGGNIIANTISKVAVKATDEVGKSLETQIIIFDKKEIVAKCNTGHEGMGNFVFWPEDKAYTAKIIYDNKTYEFSVPEIKPKGYSINVNNLIEDKLLVNFSTINLLKDETLGVSISSYGKIYYFDTICVNNKELINSSLLVNKEILPEGVNTITLFDSQGNVYCDRMFFVSKENKITTRWIAGKDNYKPFEKIDLTFYVNDSNGNPIETEFSLSVNDAYLSLYDSQKENIKTNLLLSSELKGYINNPGYYFKDDDMKRKQDLDNLMLIQGWRRYDFRIMAGLEPFDVNQFIEEGHLLKGKVLSLILRKGRKKTKIFFTLTQNKDVITGRSYCNEDGSFVLDLRDMDFYGDWEVGFYYNENGKKKYGRIEIDRFFAPKPKYFNVNETLSFTSLLGESTKLIEHEINSVEDVQELNEFVVKAKQKKKRNVPEVIHDVEKIINDHIDKGERYPENVHDFLLRNPNTLM